MHFCSFTDRKLYKIQSNQHHALSIQKGFEVRTLKVFVMVLANGLKLFLVLINGARIFGNSNSVALQAKKRV